MVRIAAAECGLASRAGNQIFMLVSVVSFLHLSPVSARSDVLTQ
jgi:hypothetical protein